MTNDSSYREKGRAAFLAAIMVLSMVAVPAVLVGPAAADHEASPTEVAVGDLDGESYWAGELNITGFNADETVAFEHEDDYVEEVADSDGSVTLVTDGLENGDWNVTGQDSGNSGEFTLRQQSIRTFEFDDDTTSANTGLTIRSDRGSYDLIIDSDNADADELQSAFGTGTTHDGNYVVSISGSTELTLDSTELETGNHTFTADVVDNEASAEAQLTVEEPGDESASFTDSAFSEEAGDVASIDVEVSNTDEAWVTVEHSDLDGNATVHLTNIDEDADNATIDVNTYYLSQGAADEDVFSVENADLGADTDQVGGFEDIGDNRWTAGYSFTLRAYTANPDQNRADDRSRLQLNERSTDELSTWVAPGDTDVAGAEDAEELTEDATESDTVAEGDILIAQVEASGIYGYLNDTADNIDPENEQLDFRLEKEESGTFGDDTYTLNASEIAEATETTMLVNGEDNEFYVAFAPSEVADTEGDWALGEDWDVVFEAGYENAYIDGEDEEDTEEINSTVSVEELELDWEGELDDNDRLQVDASSNSSIGVETNLAPNTEGDIYVETQDATYTEEVTVDEDGVASADFDFSSGENGDILDTIEATLFASQDVSIDTEGVFGEGEEASFVVTGDAPDQVDVDADATLDVTVENQGGSAGETTLTVTVDGEEVASESIELDADGTWEEGSYEIPTDEEGDIEWEVDAGSSSDSGTVTVGESEPTNETDGGDEMDGGNETDGEDTGDGDGDGQPGFGVFVALFALIGAALLALRRQN